MSVHICQPHVIRKDCRHGCPSAQQLCTYRAGQLFLQVQQTPAARSVGHGGVPVDAATFLHARRMKLVSVVRVCANHVRRSVARQGLPGRRAKVYLRPLLLSSTLPRGHSSKGAGFLEQQRCKEEVAEGLQATLDLCSAVSSYPTRQHGGGLPLLRVSRDCVITTIRGTIYARESNAPPSGASVPSNGSTGRRTARAWQLS